MGRQVNEPPTSRPETLEFGNPLFILWFFVWFIEFSLSEGAAIGGFLGACHPGRLAGRALGFIGVHLRSREGGGVEV